MQLLQLESELDEIVKLVGIDSLSPSDRLVMETAQMLREDFLQQNAMVDTDSFCSLDKQARPAQFNSDYNTHAKRALAKNAPMNKVFGIAARDRIGRAKDVSARQVRGNLCRLEREIKEQLEAAMGGAKE